MSHLPLNRHDAMCAWRAFLPFVNRYAARRNYVEPNSVSRLSSALRYRLLLEDEIIVETLARYPFESTEKWLQEVCWRRYWKGWLERRPGVWTDWKNRVRELQSILPDDVLRRAEAVMQGMGGIACMDAFARELQSTGYLHNHTRMWWASYWIHVERLPWELGAAFFYTHLLDADPAANTLSWRWVAGLQTAGKSYLVRRSNLEKYAPEWLHEYPEGLDMLNDDIVTPQSTPLLSPPLTVEPPDYPNAVHAGVQAVGLWLHDEDLLPEIGPLAELRPSTIFVGTSDARELSSLKRKEATLLALNDAKNRAEAHFKCRSEIHCSVDLATSLVTWATRNHLQEVIAFAPFVGPNFDQLPVITKSLDASGITLKLLRRDTDTHATHLAKSGFFPYWENLKRHLQKMH